jgi:hypothetical protein
VQDEREYIVITTQGLWPAAQELTAYRQLPSGGGYTTHIEDIADIDVNYTGVDLAEKMRNFITDMYLNPAYDTQYVMLLGDAHLIPYRGCYAEAGGVDDQNIPSDLYFGCLDGTWNADGDGIWGESNDNVDWYSEVYVGRIAADNSTEALNQIDKIVAFEAGDNPNSTLLLGEKLDNYPTWGGDRMEWVYSFMDSTPATKLYDKNWTWSKSDLMAEINSDEHHWINHLGHSNEIYNMRLYNSDVASMTNIKYLLVYTQGCNSGAFDYGDCFAEAITNAQSVGGAFAYIGNSRYGWYYRGSLEDYIQGASNRAHKEFMEAIFDDEITKIGEANQESKTDLDLDSQLYRWIAFETNLFGCPATDLAAQGCTSDAECDDGLYCNGAETCVEGVCQDGTPPCDDGVGCTNDSCNEDTDSCDNVPDDGLCDDGEFCNGDETCDAVEDCQAGTDPCVGQACDEVNDICVPLDCNNNGTCEEGEDCDNCPNDCISGQGGTCDACFKGVCNGECHPRKEGPDCADCAPSYCCGDGICEGAEDPANCELDCGGGGFAVCGDDICEGDETFENCPDDCPCSSDADCNDGEDCTTDLCDSETGQCSNVWPDCGYADGCCGPECTSANDTDCVSACSPRGEPCTLDSECCSGRCHRGRCK